jgi:regulator of sirC expression with transglutaminase-like and TPR domain
MATPIERLAAAADRPDADIDLVRSALQISRLLGGELDEDGQVARLDDLARQAQSRVPQQGPLRERIAAFNRFFFDELGFRGNADDFHDPCNSFLDHVLERRLGIPISLSLIYTEMGQRIRLPAWGIGFPGHFLVKVGSGDDALILDAFAGGRLLSADDLDRRLRQVYGDKGLTVRSNPRLLRAASRREILVRMLRNLKAIYLQRSQRHEALMVVSAILALVPDLPEDLRDRGLLYRELGHGGAALRDLRRFTEVAEDAEQIAAVVPLIRSLEEEPMRLH